VHLAKTWLGHKNASMTLDTYGHCIDDPEARERFERMPDWLAPIVQLEGPPVKIVGPTLLPAPEPVIEPGDEPAAVDDSCPIDVPSVAAPWVKPFIRLLDRGIPCVDAYRLIAPQIPGRRNGATAQHHVLAEFRRLKLPLPAELADRLRTRKIVALLDTYQDYDIAAKVGCGVQTVWRVRKEFNKPNPDKSGRAAKYLKRWKKTRFKDKPEPQPEHNGQFKLL
jgi:hypothetical protein